ncbi:YjcZ family sporulation protein [Paenibacillus rhizoplanae]
MGAEYGCGCGNNVGGVNQGPPILPVASPWTSTGAILVLFILLVIITKSLFVLETAYS